MSAFFFVYQWLIVVPILLIVTILVALATILLSPLLPDSQLSYAPARFWAKLVCKMLLIRVKIEGLSNINPKQSYVFILNHQSIFDIFVVYGWFPVIFKWMMKAELRKVPFIGKACASAGHIFIDRSNPIAAKRSLEIAESQLINGVSVVIFPEGTRTKTGNIGSFKKGAFRIATDLNLPIIPVTIDGSYERILRKNLRVIPGKIKVTVHPPIDVSSYLPDKTKELIMLTHQIIKQKLN